MSGSYNVEILPGAVKQIDQLQSRVRVRVLRRIATLADDPRPPGTVKLSGADDLWRIRIGDYRVLYSIRDEALIVTVVQVGHRREVYRGL